MSHEPAQSFEFFQGDTFMADGLYRTEAGVPVNLPEAGVQIEAWLQARGDRKFPLQVTFSEEVGHYHLHGASSETAKWPLGRNMLYVRYTMGDVRRTAHPVLVHVR